MKVLKNYITLMMEKIVNQKVLDAQFLMNYVPIFLFYQKLEEELKKKKLQRTFPKKQKMTLKKGFHLNLLEVKKGFWQK